MRPCYVEINLNNITDNYKEIVQVSGKKIMAVVKANAYGHGAVRVVGELMKSSADAFAVATVEEALELRAEFSDIYILILGPVPSHQIAVCILNKITIPISSYKDCLKVSAVAVDIGETVFCHYAVDTGMGRYGAFHDGDADWIVNDVVSCFDLVGVQIDGIFSHFSCADDSEQESMTLRQIKRFDNLVLKLKDVGVVFDYVHIQNSVGAILYESNVCNYARAGLVLYGYYPSVESRNIVVLKESAKWICRVSHIKSVPQGTSIGYGATFKTRKPSIIATIPVGYADGFRRELSNGFTVKVNGNLAPIVGRVCMDQSMIDITDVKNCSEGDVVELISADFNANVMADWCNTISYEILCGISQRVPRIYVK